MAAKGWAARDLGREPKLQKKAAAQRANNAAKLKPSDTAGALALVLEELKQTSERPAITDALNLQTLTIKKLPMDSKWMF